MGLRITDDGDALVIDLHGLRVADAEETLLAALRVAAARGRSSVRVIHGSSTSDPRARNETIKHRVDTLLEAGELPAVTGAFRTEGAVILSLPVSRTRDPRRIGPADLD